MHLTNIIKPTHLCNLACRYCYIEDSRDRIMTEDTLKNVIAKTFDYSLFLSPQTVVDFICNIFLLI